MQVMLPLFLTKMLVTMILHSGKLPTNPEPYNMAKYSTFHKICFLTTEKWHFGGKTFWSLTTILGHVFVGRSTSSVSAMARRDTFKID